MRTTIAKTALDPDRFRRPALFYGSAREGMRDFLDNVVVGDKKGVLLPAFIGWSAREGSGVFDPIRDSGVPYAFYALNQDLSVDIDDVTRLLDSGRYSALIIIHYYGRTEPQLEVLHQIAKERNVLFVEDLAHGYFTSTGGGPAGRFGDLCLYSLHKQFPMNDGGLAVYSDSALVSNQKGTRPELANELLSYDRDQIAQTRRRNFEVLVGLLSGLPECGTLFTLVWPTLTSFDTPQSLPIKIIVSERDYIYRRMNADGYGMVSLYHTLIPEIGESFAALDRLSRQIINFPVHQDIDERLIPFMVESFQRHLKRSPR